MGGPLPAPHVTSCGHRGPATTPCNQTSFPCPRHVPTMSQPLLPPHPSPCPQLFPPCPQRIAAVSPDVPATSPAVPDVSPVHPQPSLPCPQQCPQPSPLCPRRVPTVSPGVPAMSPAVFLAIPTMSLPFHRCIPPASSSDPSISLPRPLPHPSPAFCATSPLRPQPSPLPQVAVVPQQPVLFSRSLHANIAYGPGSWSRAEVMVAARRAGAHTFITRLPLGYDTGRRCVPLLRRHPHVPVSPS